jgi:hypothetical protein
LIAAARTAHTFQNIGVNKALQQTFKVPRRQFEPHRQSLCGERKRPRMDSYIDDRGESEMAAAGE